MRYFFLGSFLPPLKVGVPPELAFEDFILLLRENLSRRDFEKVKKIRSYIDLRNVEQLLKGEPLDSRGNLNEKELDEALVTKDGLPEYLYEYLDGYENTEEKLRHFSKVYVKFFREMEGKEKGFLSFYFNFEREWRLLMTGLRAKNLQRDLVKELQYEDFHDPLVAYLLAQKESPQFEFPFDYSELAEEVKKVKDNPRSQYEMLVRYRIEFLKEKVQDDPFSIEYILAYLAQLILAEDWNALNEKQGKKLLSTLVKEELS